MNQQTPDIYEKVTQQIIEAMERGAGSYRMPWHVTGADCFAPVNVVSKRPYRGINVLLLWLLAEHHGYTSGEWATYNQWQELGAQVRKGEKAALVVFWKISERSREETEDQEEPASNRSILARGYHVFNAAQVDGYSPKPAPVLPESERIESAERFFSRLGVDRRARREQGLLLAAGRRHPHAALLVLPRRGLLLLGARSRGVSRKRRGRTA